MRDLKYIILFDGVCNLCQRSVQFVLKHDKKAVFSFASLQGDKGRQLADQYSLEAGTMNTFILIENGQVYTRSTAALRVLKLLELPYRLLYGFIIIPPFLRDLLYRWIASNRYRFFGQTSTCWVPSPEWSARFLDQE